MAIDKNTVRVIVAVTETSSIAELWHAAVEALQETPAEMLVVFLDDERWRRAASLPFTREISRLGGGSTDFTAQRAEELILETTVKIRAEVDRLATETGQAIAFETLAESDYERTHTLVGEGIHLLIAPAALARRPIYTELTRLKLNIRLIGNQPAE